MKILKRKTLAVLLALSLLASLLPLGAQPALAGTAPQTLYVGSTTIGTGYWTSSDSGTTWARQENQPEGNNYIYYDGQGTLELHNVTIQGGSNTVSAPFGAGIYALSHSGQPVSLTIKLIGTNTITGYHGIFLNAEIDASSYGTNATLTITGENNGSLEVSGSNYGIFVKSGTGGASLNINDASVVASSSSSSFGYAGVYVMSSMYATNSPNISLAVDGGSLTTSGGESSDGILFYVGSSQATGATTRLTVSENAIVDAKNGGISAKQISNPINTNISATSSNGGIVFDGTEGTVYGDVTLQEDLTIDEGQTLTIGQGASLEIPDGKTLINSGTVTTEEGGTLTNNGIIDNSGTLPDTISGNQPPKINTQPQSVVVTIGQTAEFTVVASASEGDALSYQWQQKTTDSGSDWTNVGSTTSSNTYTIDNTTTSMSSYQYRCVVSNSAGSVTSNAATLTVNSVPVTGVTLDETELALYTGGSATLSATVTPENATNKSLTWSSDKPEVATVENGKVTAKAAGTATITVTTEDGSKTATCTVTVTAKTYSLSVDKSTLNFGSITEGEERPAAQTVTVKNTGNQRVTLVQPTATNFEITTSDNLTLNAGESVKFTIHPKDKLPRGSYSEQITITDSNNVMLKLTASFTVKEPPYTGKYSYELTASVGDHGSLTVDRYATEGEKVTITVTPDDAYLLDELVVTAGGKDVELVDNGDGTYTFTMPSADVKITATFAKDPDWTEPEEPATDVSDIFLDIAPNAWYKDAVQYAYDNGLMTGVSANEFAPEATTTRAMIVSMLARLEGVESAESAGFADVAANDWYATAVNWAAASGITSGTGDGNFSPNTAITREQLAAILMNYAQYKGQDVSARATLDTYNDAAAISSWANDVMSWAVAEGLLTGVTNDQLQPQGNATRAQVAAIFERFLAE